MFPSQPSYNQENYRICFLRVSKLAQGRKALNLYLLKKYLLLWMFKVSLQTLFWKEYKLN